MPRPPAIRSGCEMRAQSGEEHRVAVKQWDVFEIALTGPAGGNPFCDVQLSARFSSKDRSLDVTGFYDGDGRYLIRFMPDAQGAWRYETRSSAADLNGRAGTFDCIAPAANAHGPVRVHNTFHFAYAD